jgi:hypothetical protein
MDSILVAHTEQRLLGLTPIGKKKAKRIGVTSFVA